MFLDDRIKVINFKYKKKKCVLFVLIYVLNIKIKKQL